MFDLGLFVTVLVVYSTYVRGGLIQEEGQVKNEERIQLFRGFLQKYDKVYSSAEEHEKRFAIFSDNMDKIEVLQAKEQGTALYGVTEFSDLTTEEFVRKLGYRKLAAPLEIREAAEIPEVELPEHFDWRSHKVVTPVKDQQQCGSCWAFSTVGNIESQWAIKTGRLMSLSEQELLDCDKADNACNGGNSFWAITTIKDMGGLESEEDYPYEAVEGQCRFNKTKVKALVKGVNVLPPSEDDMAKWIFKKGPVSAALNAVLLQSYKGGIHHPSKDDCSPNSLNHAVLLVGFAVEKTSSNESIPYWIVKNSWGERFGENGYFKIFRGDETCGINRDVVSAEV